MKKQRFTGNQITQMQNELLKEALGKKGKAAM